MERKKKLQKRFYAFYIDLVAITFLQRFMVYSFEKGIKNLFPTMGHQIKSMLLENTWQLTLSTLCLTYFSYFALSLFLGEGRTFGKSLLGLRVYSIENTTPDLLESLQRTLVYTGCYLLGSFLLLIPFLRKDAIGLPDMISHTKVLTDAEFEKAVENQNKTKVLNSQLELFKEAS